MKLFKTTAIIAALASSFSANAALKTLDDAALTEVTGQEGITIVMKAEIKNLDVAYSDNEYTAAGAVDTGKGGTLGLDGIKTEALTITQTVDIVAADETSGAVKDADLKGVGHENDRILKMTVKGIQGTFTVGAIRVGKDTTTAIGDATAFGDTAFNTGRATSLGSLTLGNLTTGGDGIAQYIFAH